MSVVAPSPPAAAAAAAAPAPPSPPPPPPSSRSRHSSLLPYLLRCGPFSAPGYERDATAIDILRAESRVLVVGAGGLGCELLKGLALSGVGELHVVDLDTIDVSNLNRQFLFRMPDCGQPKAKVAAERVMARCPGATVHWYDKPLQDFPASWYRKFDVVIAGLDNVEARQWLNATLVDLVRFDASGVVDPSSVIPLIDGGTEGFGGQARVFLPRLTSCFECSLPSMPPQLGFAVCTIRNVPRLPEHCVLYALKVEWPMLRSFADPAHYELYERTHAGDDHAPAAVSLDKDDAGHMTWLYERAERRAQQFGIGGVTYALTMQVVKNIIPAIASTNALIAAACVNECWKLRTNAALRLDNYFMYMGGQPTGTHCETIQYKQNESCTVCRKPHVLPLDGSVHQPTQCKLSPSMTLHQLIACIESELGVQRASVSRGGAVLYLTTLHSDYQANLSKPLSELHIAGGDILTVNASGKTGKILVLF